MEYKLSSFQFSKQMGRKEKHYIITRINSVRSQCPSDSSFTGEFSFVSKKGKSKKGQFYSEVKVLFSTGQFMVNQFGSSMEELMDCILQDLRDQVQMWKQMRFKQTQGFVDYSEKRVFKKGA